MNRQAQTSIPVGEKTDNSSERCKWIDPELEKWTRRNAVLAQQFTMDLAGCNQSANVYFGFVVQIAADYVWATSRSKPDWAELDVDGLQREILQERLRLDDIATGNFNISLAAFYTFLFRRKHLAKKAAVRVLRRLERYDNNYVSETFALADGQSRSLRARSAHSSSLHRRAVTYSRPWTSLRTNPHEPSKRIEAVANA